MSKITRIFEVEYNCQNTFNGKTDSTVFHEKENAVAVNAMEAIRKVEKSVVGQRNTIDDDEHPGKKIKVGYANFDPINVALLAEA